MRDSDGKHDLKVASEPQPSSQLFVLPAVGWSDAAIVEGLRQRDPDAAAALYDRIGDRVNRIIWRMLGEDSEHDDLVHQVFVEALNAISTLRSSTSLDSWMVGIALNTVRHELRRRKRSRSFFKREGADVADDRPGQDPLRSLISRRFYTALERLSPDERIAFTLRFVEGDSLAEVALATGCSLATIKRRLERARAAFIRQARRDAILSAWLEGEGHAGA